MAEQNDQERHLPASQKRLDEARERGQVPRARPGWWPRAGMKWRRGFAPWQKSTACRCSKRRRWLPVTRLKVIAHAEVPEACTIRVAAVVSARAPLPG